MRVERMLAGVPSDELSTAVRQEAVREALMEYSRDRPRVVVEDVTGDGGQFYEIGTGEALVEWDDEFSVVLAIDYPAATVADDDEPEWLEAEDWAVYRVGTTRYLYFPNHSPSAAETARVWYATVYEFDANNETDAPAVNFDAICTLAGGICCEWLAIRYGQHGDSTIAADVVNHRSKSDIYASRARELRKRYAELLGRGEDLEAAAFVGDVDMGWAVGRDFLFHGRRGR